VVDPILLIILDILAPRVAGMDIYSRLCKLIEESKMDIDIDIDRTFDIGRRDFLKAAGLRSHLNRCRLWFYRKLWGFRGSA